MRTRTERVSRALDYLIWVLLAVVAIGGLAFWWLRRGPSGFDGQARLTGLQAPVAIVRDTRGIPHITAGNVHDLVLAQGYAMAQDRLWQMDLMRRLGEGQLAEVFGPDALSLDEENWRLGLPQTAVSEADRLRPDDAALLQAFATGVNDYIAQIGWRLPLEFWLLRYRPAPWKTRDSLALAAYMYKTLATDYDDKLMRESFAVRLGPAQSAQLFPDVSPWDVPPGAPPPIGLAPLLSGGRGRGLAPLPVFPAPSRGGRARGGSNNWVLSGARTFSGKPILANDPHLQFQIPGLWWAVELSAPEVQVAGVAIVGLPGVIIGHNQYIAWGATNGYTDTQDLYRVPAQASLRREIVEIPVRGARAPVRYEVTWAPQGPVVAHDAGGPLALAWTMYTPGALQEVHVFLDLDEAHNWREFEAALAQFAGPAQNFVYADTAGHIGYQCAGWVPLRRGFDGSVPVPGDGAHDWQSWVPFSQLPEVADPTDGVLATANGRTTSDRYPYVLSTNWGAPNRTRRIYQLLGALPKWNASGMARIQTDVVSEQDRDFAQAVVAAGDAAVARGQFLGAATRQALGLLRGFRGAMGHTSLAPTLAVETRAAMLQRVVAGQTNDAMARSYHWGEAPVFEQWLVATRPAQWLPLAYRGARGGGWDQLLLDCLTDVAQRYTTDPNKLRWGNFETLDLLHPVFSHVPFLNRSADLGPVEINGSPLTIKQAQSVALGDTSTIGPSMRMVDDLADWDRSTLTLVAGESGDVFSSHYSDNWMPYLRGQGLALWFTPAAVAAHRAHALQLRP